MNPRPEESAYEREFAVRYRLPRPLSRSYESILYARDPAEIRNKIEWCAATAVRFIAALRQALYLTTDFSTPAGPPGTHDFKLETDLKAFRPLASMPPPVLLLRHAGMYTGPVDRDSRASLLDALEPAAFLCRYRIACRERDGFRVLLGQRVEYVIWTDSLAGEIDEGTPILVDTENGDYLSLGPLAVWRRDPHRPLGSFMVLRSARETAGRYVEDGVPGSPAIELPMAGRPHTGSFAAGDPALGLIRDPGVRYTDGLVEGEYAVKGVIWKGSMSDVYAAWNRRRNVPIVLKTFESRGAGFDENYWHFINEEKYSRGAGHGGVVKPARVVQERLGLVYEEEFADGGSLGDVLEDRGVMPLDRARAVALGLLEILEDVHAQGIAHNDIKPDNILFDGEGRVRLIDFGIAWDFLRDRGELRGGTRVGSEGYIAPELLAGGTPSAHSDLYSFGVVFSRMLGGRPAATAGEAAGLRSIPRQYLPFFERCLAADPGERFASAGAARAALAGITAAQERAITLDIEGTLVTDYGSRHPRPGLAGFIGFCLRNFDRIFVYTSLTAGQAGEVFGRLLETGAVPAEFCERYEYVEWPRGAGGTVKDLRRCGFPIEHNAIVDDMEVMIPDDQRHRWVPVPNYSDRGMPDSGFHIALEDLRGKFGIM
ncbi:MAG TPA: serine/threonine-protein kinase [Spirochaetota bacterium]|nr:serine/threonine-protein kinase [Spirochaetota bacterium]